MSSSNEELLNRMVFSGTSGQEKWPPEETDQRIFTPQKDMLKKWLKKLEESEAKKLTDPYFKLPVGVVRLGIFNLNGDEDELTPKKN